MTKSTRGALALGAGLLSLVLAGPVAAQAAPTTLGDFDGDGNTDLAVGAPADSVSGQQRAGAVNVIYGTPNGLSESRDQQFTQSSIRIGGVPTPGAEFGRAVASGDIDGDGHADLAIGAPGQQVGGLQPGDGAGEVVVLYGSPSGLREAGGDLWSQNSLGIKGGADAEDRFGSALGIDDFDGDGYADLSIGAPGEDVGGASDAGAVNVIYGTSDGLTERGDDLYTQNSPGIKGLAGTGHRMGASLAAGDLSGNERAELAIGIPGGRIGGDARAGAVLVLYGRGSGLSTIDDLWSQDARGIKGVAEVNDGFGDAVAIGDFDGDGGGDLAIGAPFDDVGNADGAGAVHVLFGSRRGVTSADELWTQDTPGIKSRASIGDTFGNELAAADFSGNEVDDLAIGVPGEEIGGEVAAGAVAVLYGTGTGLREEADQLWSQDSRGVKGRAERSDRFGLALSTGDFDGDGVYDLAVGAPFDSVRGFRDAGAVNVLYGSGSGLREAGDELWTQGTRGIKGAVGNDEFGAALAGGTARD